MRTHVHMELTPLSVDHEDYPQQQVGDTAVLVCLSAPKTAAVHYYVAGCTTYHNHLYAPLYVS